MQRVEVAESRGRLHLRGNVAVLQAVDLVDRNHDGLPEAEHTASHEAVARADVLPRVDDEEHDVDVVEGLVDRLLHALGQRVEGPLEAG